MRVRSALAIVLAAAPLAAAAGAEAAAAADAAPTGSDWLVGFPFIGLAVAVAVMAAASPDAWSRFGVGIAAVSVASFVGILAVTVGVTGTLSVVVHALASEAVPVASLVLAQCVIAGGIRVSGLSGTPGSNAAVLGTGLLLAGAIGSIGAAVLLQRPLLRGNAWRSRQVHLHVFLVFTVGALGGALSPLGSPPLLIGFLRGMDFLSAARQLVLPVLLVGAVMLALFLLVDWRLWRQDRDRAPPPAHQTVTIEGGGNLLLLLLTLPCALLPIGWDGASIDAVAGVAIDLSAAARDLALLALACLSLLLTPRGLRAAAGFAWRPVVAMSALLFAMVLTAVPAATMLQGGAQGLPGRVVAVAAEYAGMPPGSAMFWLSGIAAAAFGSMPATLALAGETSLHPTAALGGALLVGAMTYGGSVVGLLTRETAEAAGVRMPGPLLFAVWAALFLLPSLILAERLFFR